MVRAALLSLLVAGVTSSAWAANWVNACVPDGAADGWHIDSASLKIERGQPVAWLKQRFPQGGGAAREERVRVRFDCIAWKMSALEWSRHKGDGSLLGSGRLPDTPNNYRELQSESVFDTTATKLCSQIPVTAGLSIPSKVSTRSSGAAVQRKGLVTIDRAIQQLGGRITSGRRTAGLQRALFQRGVTRVLNSAHVFDRARDIVGLTRQQIFAAARLAQVEVQSLIWESGRGRYQGTGPHWHLEFGRGPPTRVREGGRQLRWRTCEGMRQTS